MKALVVEFVIQVGKESSFREVIVENARASVANEPGCHQFDVCTDADRGNVFFLYELYENDAAITAHLASGHYQRMNTLTLDWVEKKTVWRYDRIAS